MWRTFQCDMQPLRLKVQVYWLREQTIIWRRLKTITIKQNMSISAAFPLEAAACQLFSRGRLREPTIQNFQTTPNFSTIEQRMVSYWWFSKFLRPVFIDNILGRSVGCGGVLYCTVYCMPYFFKSNLYFEFYYNRRWFYLLILVTITCINLPLLNLKQMLEVLTAQLLGLGVR